MRNIRCIFQSTLGTVGTKKVCASRGLRVSDHDLTASESSGPKRLKIVMLLFTLLH